jgi:hypothetical protein
MRKLTLTGLLAGGLTLAGAPATFTGVITDTMCGADHKAMGISPDSKCVRECVRMQERLRTERPADAGALCGAESESHRRAR